MEEDLDILKYFKVEKPEPINYYAEYNLDTGEIIKVGPEYALRDVKNKILLDSDIAIDILTGKTRLSGCFVDRFENKFSVSEVRNVVKIDDLLHRISEEQFVNFDYSDISVTVNVEKKTIKIEMSEEFNGTKKIPKKFYPIIKRNIHWNGETMMYFYLTSYNDPTLIKKVFSLSINDLRNQSKTFKIDEILGDDFSIFTRRIFKNYSLIKK